MLQRSIAACILLWPHDFFFRRPCLERRRNLMMRVNPPLAFGGLIGYVGKRPNWMGGWTGPRRRVR